MAEKNPALRRRRTLNGLDSVAVLPKLNCYGASADLATEASLSSPVLSSGALRLILSSPEGALCKPCCEGDRCKPAVREDGEHFCELIGQEITVQ